MKFIIARNNAAEFGQVMARHSVPVPLGTVWFKIDVSSHFVICKSDITLGFLRRIKMSGRNFLLKK